MVRRTKVRASNLDDNSVGGATAMDEFAHIICDFDVTKKTKLLTCLRNLYQKQESEHIEEPVLEDSEVTHYTI